MVKLIAKHIPESSFVWRRVFSYALAASFIGLGFLIVSKIDDAKTLRDMFKWVCYLQFWGMTFYMIAPTAEQLIDMLKEVRLARFGGGTNNDNKSSGPSE